MRYLYILSFFIFLLFSCNKKNQQKENVSESVVSSYPEVFAKKVSLDTFNKQIIANGKVEAFQKSNLRFKNNERLTSIKVKNGDKVAKGQVLATLDYTILTNNINKAKLELEKANSKLQEEKINYGIDSDSKIPVDPNLLKNLEIKTGYLEAKNNLENAQFNYSNAFLKAPFSGVIANIEKKLGDFITPNDIFCTLIDSKRMIVSFSILENELPLLKMNQDINIIPFTDNNKIYKGKIIEINPIVDENSLIKIKASIMNSQDILFDGMSVKTIVNKPIKNVITIPKEALVLRSNREVVFTVKDSLAKWNYVQIIGENSTQYAIGEGLKTGDTIVVSGNMNLSHDAKINMTLILKN